MSANININNTFASGIVFQNTGIDDSYIVRYDGGAANHYIQIAILDDNEIKTNDLVIYEEAGKALLNGVPLLTSKDAAKINIDFTYSGNLTHNPSISKIASVITNPVDGRAYFLEDTSNHGFFIVYDDGNWWYEKLTKAV
jgi:hypothetical protein